MTSRVEWTRAAQNELAAIWTRSDSSKRAAITRAAHRIDQILSANPSDAGESRGDDERILHESPLGILFVVDDDDRAAFVFHVWDYD